MAVSSHTILGILAPFAPSVPESLKHRTTISQQTDKEVVIMNEHWLKRGDEQNRKYVKFQNVRFWALCYYSPSLSCRTVILFSYRG